MRTFFLLTVALASSAAQAQSPPSAIVRQRVQVQDFDTCVATAKRLLAGHVSGGQRFTIRESSKSRFVVARRTHEFVCDGRDPIHN